MKLLIVDDHAAMRRLLGRVVSGAEALNAYHRCLPDWVLMDIEMDRIDGITATREILLSYPRARVVIVSKYDDDQTREAAEKRSLRICAEREPHGNPRAAAGTGP